MSHGINRSVLQPCLCLRPLRSRFSMQSHSPSDDRRDSFVSEDLNDMEHALEIHEKEDEIDQRKHRCSTLEI
jgi:hypothetical protein